MKKKLFTFWDLRPYRMLIKSTSTNLYTASYCFYTNSLIMYKPPLSEREVVVSKVIFWQAR